MRFSLYNSILRAFLVSLIAVISCVAKGQEKQLKHTYSSGQYQMEMWQLDGRDVEIRIKKNNQYYDQLDLLAITDKTTFGFEIGSRNKDTGELFAHVHSELGRFFFSNFYEVFEYDLKEKKVRKILTQGRVSNTTYRIMKVLESGVIIFLQGYVLEHNKLLVEHSGGNKFIHAYYDVVNETIESVKYSVINDFNGGVYVQPLK
ncbi:MAG: hypothetical protein ACFB2Y_02650 [Fulvivirga sp.]